MVNEHPEFHVVKRFVTIGPFKDWVNIPFFPVGFATLWEHTRDEAIIAKSLKEIDLISVQTEIGSTLKLGGYKTLFQFLCHTNTVHKPIPSLNFQEWKAWQEKLKKAKVWIFEAKSSKGYIAQAMGQILTYKELFSKDYPRTQIIGCGIINEATNETDALAQEACRGLGIKVFRM